MLSIVYNGASKTITEGTSAQIYYVPQVNYKDDFIITHEVGHALGWRGHGGVRDDLMCKYALANRGVFVLSTNEKNHIKQVY